MWPAGSPLPTFSNRHFRPYTVSQHQQKHHQESEVAIGRRLSVFRQIAEDALGLVRAGDLSRAKSRVSDLVFAWDNVEARLRPMNQEKWASVDDSIDNVLRKLRAVRPDPAACTKSLESLIAVLNTLDKRQL